MVLQRAMTSSVTASWYFLPRMSLAEPGTGFPYLEDMGGTGWLYLEEWGVQQCGNVAPPSLSSLPSPLAIFPSQCLESRLLQLAADCQAVVTEGALWGRDCQQLSVDYQQIVSRLTEDCQQISSRLPADCQ